MLRKVLLFLSVTCLLIANENNTSVSVWDTIKNDYKNYYTDKDRLVRFGIAFGIGGIIANTNIDQSFQNRYQDNIRSKSTDDFSKIVKQFGNGKITIPFALLASSLNLAYDDSIIGKWGAYTSRAFLVGAPGLLAMQFVTGGSRPSEKRSYHSSWRPFKDNNGVSGHAFMGSIPFLVIYKMSDNVYLKYSAFAASFLTAWSRVNDNQHYLSQIALGWYMGYEAVDSVFQTNKQRGYAFEPFIKYDAVGLAYVYRW